MPFSRKKDIERLGIDRFGGSPPAPTYKLMGPSNGTGMISMTGKEPFEFVDTNVLVYAYDRSAGEKHDIARDLLLRLWDTGQGCLSVQVLQEFYVTITCKVARPLGISEAAEILQDLKFWNIHSPSPDDVLSAIDIQKQYQVSFWDAMILHSAMYLSCKTLWSEDLSDKQEYYTVRVVNPFKVQNQG
jgi:predicted nucleic acid-binding protein